MKIIHVTKTISFLAMLGLIGNVNAQQVVPITSADCGLNLSGNTSYELTEDLS